MSSAILAHGHRPHVVYRTPTGLKRGTVTPAMQATVSCLVLAATALYLTIEVPFATRLVAALGQGADAAAVERIERLGRFVSGAALALAVCGWMLRKWVAAYKPAPVIALRLLLVASACIGIVMIGQKTLVDHLAESSSDEVRRAALRGAVARDAIAGTAAGDSVKQVRIGLTPFLSVLTTAPYDGLKTREAAARAYAASAFTDTRAYRDAVAAPLMAELRRAYDAYAKGDRAVSQAREQAGPHIEQSWSRLQDDIARRRLDLSSRPVREEIARQVRANGFPVRPGWHPMDRRAFVEAGWEGSVGHAERKLGDETKAAIGTALPAGLGSYEGFLAHPALQARIRKTLGLPEKGAAIRLGATADATAHAFHDQARKRYADRFAEALSGPGAPLPADLRAPGRDAVRLAYAAAFGIVLSALGAAAHLCKLAFHAAQAFTAALPAKSAKLAGVAAVAVLLAMPARPADLPGGMAGAILAWASGLHGLVQPAGHALSASPALAAADALVAALPGR